MGRPQTPGFDRQCMAIQVQQPENRKQSFTFNPVMLAVAGVALASLYYFFDQHRVRYFVYISMLVNLSYPFLLKLRQREIEWRVVLLQGTLISSLLYDCWTLYFPHRVLVYYIPQLLSGVAKVYDLLSSDRSQTAGEFCRFNSKIQLLVVLYGVVSFLARFKLSWARLLKVLLMVLIFRFKLWTNYGCQVACEEVHLMMDRLAKGLLVRRQYQMVYAKLAKLGNRHNQLQEWLL